MYSIAQLEAETGTTRRTIHFYVQQGILPAPVGAGPRAAYDETHRMRLLAVPRLRANGWRLDQIRSFFQRASMTAIARVVETGRAPSEEDYGSAEGGDGAVSASEAEQIVRYRLAPGVELLVSSNASVRDRSTVERSLHSIARLFRDQI